MSNYASKNKDSILIKNLKLFEPRNTSEMHYSIQVFPDYSDDKVRLFKDDEEILKSQLLSAIYFQNYHKHDYHCIQFLDPRQQNEYGFHVKIKSEKTVYGLISAINLDEYDSDLIDKQISDQINNIKTLKNNPQNYFAIMDQKVFSGVIVGNLGKILNDPSVINRFYLANEDIRRDKKKSFENFGFYISSKIVDFETGMQSDNLLYFPSIIEFQKETLDEEINIKSTCSTLKKAILLPTKSNSPTGIRNIRDIKSYADPSKKELNKNIFKTLLIAYNQNDKTFFNANTNRKTFVSSKDESIISSRADRTVLATSNGALVDGQHSIHAIYVILKGLESLQKNVLDNENAIELSRILKHKEIKEVISNLHINIRNKDDLNDLKTFIEESFVEIKIQIIADKNQALKIADNKNYSTKVTKVEHTSVFQQEQLIFLNSWSENNLSIGIKFPKYERILELEDTESIVSFENVLQYAFAAKTIQSTSIETIISIAKKYKNFDDKIFKDATELFFEKLYKDVIFKKQKELEVLEKQRGKREREYLPEQTSSEVCSGLELTEEQQNELKQIMDFIDTEISEIQSDLNHYHKDGNIKIKNENFIRFAIQSVAVLNRLFDMEDIKAHLNPREIHSLDFKFVFYCYLTNIFFKEQQNEEFINIDNYKNYFFEFIKKINSFRTDYSIEHLSFKNILLPSNESHVNKDLNNQITIKTANDYIFGHYENELKGTKFKSFSSLGLKEGDILKYHKGSPVIKAKILQDNYVEVTCAKFETLKETFQLATRDTIRKIEHAESYSPDPLKYWKFENKLLFDIYQEKEREKKIRLLSESDNPIEVFQERLFKIGDRIILLNQNTGKVHNIVFYSDNLFERDSVNNDYTFKNVTSEFYKQCSQCECIHDEFTVEGHTWQILSVIPQKK